jgi:hypothetical protein
VRRRDQTAEPRLSVVEAFLIARRRTVIGTYSQALGRVLTESDVAAWSESWRPATTQTTTRTTVPRRKPPAEPEGGAPERLRRFQASERLDDGRR